MTTIGMLGLSIADQPKKPPTAHEDCMQLCKKHSKSENNLLKLFGRAMYRRSLRLRYSRFSDRIVIFEELLIVHLKNFSGQSAGSRESAI